MPPTPRLPILALLTGVITFHLLLAHYVFHLPVNPFALPEPLLSLLLLLVVSFLANLFRPQLVRRFLSSYPSLGREDWWQALVRLVQWCSFVSLFFMILGLDRNVRDDEGKVVERQWMDDGTSGLLLVAFGLLAIFPTLLLAMFVCQYYWS